MISHQEIPPLCFLRTGELSIGQTSAISVLLFVESWPPDCRLLDRATLSDSERGRALQQLGRMRPGLCRPHPRSGGGDVEPSCGREEESSDGKTAQTRTASFLRDRGGPKRKSSARLRHARSLRAPGLGHSLPLYCHEVPRPPSDQAEDGTRLRTMPGAVDAPSLHEGPQRQLSVYERILEGGTEPRTPLAPSVHSRSSAGLRESPTRPLDSATGQ